jgi:hypothetical protein
MIAVLGGLADVEHDLIRSRTAEGRSRAKKRGQHMGRPPKLTTAQQADARRRRAEGSTLVELARSYSVGKSTISRLDSKKGRAMPRWEDGVIWFIFAAYVIAMLTAVVGQHNTTGWHHAIRRFHIFEALLVVVAVLQWLVLSRTDEALHLAARAQDSSAETAEKLRLFTEATNRAWLGPVSARSEPFEDGKPVKITITINNTGRLPATFRFSSGGVFFTRDYWEDGRANSKIDPAKSLCMTGLSRVEQSATQQGLAYPTTGFSSYTVTYDSTRAANNRFVLTQPDLRSDRIFAIIGCFVYSDIYGKRKRKKAIITAFFATIETPRTSPM